MLNITQIGVFINELRSQDCGCGRELLQQELNPQPENQRLRELRGVLAEDVIKDPNFTKWAEHALHACRFFKIKLQYEEMEQLGNYLKND